METYDQLKADLSNAELIKLLIMKGIREIRNETNDCGGLYTLGDIFKETDRLFSLCTVEPQKIITFRDGAKISIKAGSGFYSAPRKDGADSYSEVECGAYQPAESGEPAFEELEEYRSGDVYPFVPAAVVRRLIDHHYGIKKGACPELA